MILASLEEFEILNKGAYPTSLQPLVMPDADGHSYLDGYSGSIPKDPWKHEYHYEPPTSAYPKPHVWSYGADGKRGGTADDADIDSNDLLEND
jgi:general secretion pathway protein G